MITILVVAVPPADLAPLCARYPSVEILGASNVEDALEKLARNRRIDAVLLTEASAPAAAAAIRDEDPGAPPVFAPASAGQIPGVQPLVGATTPEVIEALVHLLSADG